MTLLARSRSLLAATLIALLAACGGGGGGGSTPPVQPTPTPTQTLAPTSAFTCPTSDTQLAVSRGGSSSSASETRHGVRKGGAASSTSQLAISYRTSAIANPATTLDARVASFGATKLNEFAYPKLGLATRLLHVTPSTIAQVASTLRATPGVVSVSPTQRLSALAVTHPFEGNDPYFVGASGMPAPLYQNASTGGQWDMHIVQLDYAFGYSQAGNGSGITNANALGSTSVKLAIIDTGEDVTHPELAKASIARTECFITNEAGTAQSTGTFVTDGFGHGTDVTGIAVANANNAYGFVGDGGNVSLMLYRVFQLPTITATTRVQRPQCSTDDTDIASAIDDAVANGANVISMSLGGGVCTSAGVDPDPVEGNAVANAIAHNVIVVAASGNAGGQGVDAPACDANVIAAGASGYEDGQANGTNAGRRRNRVRHELHAIRFRECSGQRDLVGIEAPGGIPQTPMIRQRRRRPTIYTGSRTSGRRRRSIQILPDVHRDHNIPGGNCRTLIAGTSMATPHIAGAAALILSVNSTYASPTKMFQLLCTTADNISDPHQGCGRLNVYRAMATALSHPNPPT